MAGSTEFRRCGFSEILNGCANRGYILVFITVDVFNFVDPLLAFPSGKLTRRVLRARKADPKNPRKRKNASARKVKNAAPRKASMADSSILQAENPHYAYWSFARC